MGETTQFPGGVRADNSASRQKKRTLGSGHEVGCTAQLIEIRAIGGIIGPHAYFFRPDEFDALRHKVLGEVDKDWTGAPGTGQVKGLAHSQRQALQILDQKIMFGARACNAHDIHFLKGIIANEMSMHLPGNGDNRNRIGVGSGQTGHNIGSAGARRNQTNAHLAGCTSIPVGSMSGTLFMPYQNMSESLITIKIVINIQHGPAGVTENNIHTLTLQAFKKNARTCHLHVDPILKARRTLFHACTNTWKKLTKYLFRTGSPMLLAPCP